MFIKERGITEIITQEDIQNNKNLHDSICRSIQFAYDTAESGTSLWRAYHTKVDSLVKQLHTDDRMVYDLLFSYKKSFVAMFQNEGLTPVFSERDYFDKDIAEKINKIADFDIENMKKSIKDKKMLGDIFDYGVGLRVYDGFDMVNKCATFIVPSPLSWYFDPNGSTLGVDFDYHIFSWQTSLPALKYDNAIRGGYFCLDDVNTGVQTKNSENIDGKRQRLQNTGDGLDETVYIYNCFVTLNGHRYFCTVANDQTKIIRWERFLPRTPEERKDGTLVPFKLSISNAMIDQYSPCGISYREKIYPVQVALSKMINAIHNKQLRDAGNTIYGYDIDAIDNPATLLERPSNGPLFIPVRPGSGNVITPIIESNDTSKSDQYIKQLEYYAENTTALTGIVRGLTPDAGTLGEAEIQMQKSNALFSVDSTTLVEGERQFRTNIYYRSLVENLPRIREKATAIGLTGGDLVILKNSELRGFNTPYIAIKNKRQEIDLNNKKVSSMQAMLPILLQDQTISQASKKLFKRELMELQGLDPDFVKTVESIDPSERHSMLMSELINAGEKPDNLIVPGLDLETLWIYLNACIDSDIKEQVLSQLNLLMIEQGLKPKEQPNPGMQGVANSMASQSLSSDIAQRQQAVPAQM